MSVYRRAEAVQTITLLPPISTIITLEIRGSEDNYATDRREFSTEEQIQINGTVTAADGADLSQGIVETYLDRIFQGETPLTFNPTTTTNHYVFPLGLIPENSHEIRVTFPRLRLWAASQLTAKIATRAEIPTLPIIAITGAAIVTTLIITIILLKHK